jgi:UDP-2,3-diacylglucosamine hydrolase
MNDIYFISDAHLGFKNTEEETGKRRKLLGFLEFLETSGNTRELYVLGDLFDFWFEWYHVIPKYWFPILHKLKKLVESGINVTLITGNHDFHTGSYLEKEIGIRCIDEFHDFEIGSKRFFAAHGDGLAKKDRGYRFIKRIIRHRLSIFLYKTFIPADLGMQIARWTSKSSRKLNRFEKQSWSEEYYKFAKEKFDEGFDYVILGHIHYPMIREEENNGKTYVNCGDWIKHFTYAVYDGSRLMLKDYTEFEKN